MTTTIRNLTPHEVVIIGPDGESVATYPSEGVASSRAVLGGAPRARAAELCAGYGGIGLALRHAGIDTELAWWSEIDPHACTVMAAHHDAPNVGDLTTVDWAQVEPVDILTAGFPCQPISTAGRRRVTADDRWIWPHIAHAVRVLRPRWVLLENVPPLLRPWRDSDGWWNPAPVEEVVGDLAQAGYVGSWRSVRAADVGAPHRRERVFIAAHTDRPTRRRPGHTQPGDHAPTDGRRGPQEPRGRGGPTTHTDRLAAGWDAGAVPPETPGARRQGGLLAPVAHDHRADAADPDSQGPQGFGYAALPGRHIATISHEAPADPDSDRLLPATDDEPDGRLPAGGRHALGPYGPAVERWEGILGRPAPAPVDDQGRLSPLLVEWMMGLSAGWVTGLGLPRTAELRVLGNGVVPQQAAEAIRSMGVVGPSGS